ncbi:hypothetical protein LTR17_006890 [Elasticomyces elasticus]|nr:hypothetical protein LTR17_006890 [Elasticomyces elasticus]
MEYREQPPRILSFFDSMLPPTISDRYRRYKSGTKKAVHWLAITAGSVRTRAPPKAGEIVKLPTTELRRLTDCIVQRASLGRLPPSGIKSTIFLLEDVVAGRRECSTWYKQNAKLCAEKQWGSDSSHAFFTRTLQWILEQLRSVSALGSDEPRRKVAGSKEKKQPPKSVMPVWLTKTFEGLRVEETRSDTDHDEPVASPNLLCKSESTSLPPTEEYDAEDNEDADLAIWCHDADCRNIADFLCETWTDYTKGKMSLLVASEVTSEAVMLARTLSEHFVTEFPHLASFDDIAKHLGIDGTDPESSRSKDARRGGSAANDILDVFCMPAYICLKLLRTLHDGRGKRVEQTQQEYRDVLMSHRFMFSVMETWENLHSLKPYLDEWCRHGDLDILSCDFVRSTDLKKPVPLQSIVALQIYMGIAEIVAQSKGAEWNTLLAVGIETKRRINEHEVKAATAKKGDAEDAKQTTNRTICKDRISAALDKTFERSDIVLDTSLLDYDCVNWRSFPALSPLLLHLPVLCGHIANTIAIPDWLDGLERCNDGKSVLSIAHIYTACLDHGYLTGQWLDMDFAIGKQGAPKLKLWEKSSTVASVISAARHLDLALGGELPKAIGQRAPMPSDSRVLKRSVRFEPTTMYYEAHRETLAAGHGAVNEQSGRDVLYRLANKVLSLESTEPNDAKRNQLEMTKTLAPDQLLSILRSRLEGDEVEQSFEFRLLYERCAELFEEVKERLPLRLQYLRDEEGLETTCHDYRLASAILWQAARASASGIAGMEDTVLRIFGRILQEHIDRGYGSELIDAAEKRVDQLRYSGVVADRDESKQMDMVEQAAQLAGVAANQTAGKVKGGRRRTSKK